MTSLVSGWFGGIKVAPALLAAEVGSRADGSDPWSLLLQHVVAAGVFAFMGICIFVIGVWLFVKISPFSVRKEIEEDQNTALGIIMGSVLLGLSIIIAAAILG